MWATLTGQAEPESMSKAFFKAKETRANNEIFERGYNGRVRRGVFVHSAVNTAAPGVSIQPPVNPHTN